MTSHLFKQVEENFMDCLNAGQSEQAITAMEKLKISLLAIEEYSEEAKNHSAIFIQIFQFELISSDPFWKQTPKLYAVIGEFIHELNSYESSFRNNVEQEGLGPLMKFSV